VPQSDRCCKARQKPDDIDCEVNRVEPRICQLHYSCPVSSNYKIAIVGIGPRGLAVIERVLSHAGICNEVSLELILFDPGNPGPGCHSVSDSSESLLNTLASQITQFPSDSEVDAVKRLEGPDFDTWAGQTGAARTHSITIGNQEHYYPRALFGSYLSEAYETIFRSAPPNVTIRFYRTSISQARIVEGRWSLVAKTNVFEGFDFLHVSTGHGFDDDSRTNETVSPVPVNFRGSVAEVCSPIAAEETVAMEGLGLIAIDIIAELTAGRGGRFELDDQDGELRYIPSGLEPHILAYSRSGLPLMARPVSQKKLTSHPPAAHFTEEVARHLRENGPVDFEAQALPLLIEEMATAFNDSVKRGRQSSHGGQTVKDLGGAQHQPFSWESLVNPIPPDALGSQSAFSSFLLEYLRNDINEASKGNLGSPVKAACDVLRELRERIALLVDFDGLSGESHAWFYRQFVPLLKRLSVGPPLLRIQQIRALIRAGVLTMDFGPNARCEPNADGWRVRSNLWSDYSRQATRFIRARLTHPMETPVNPLIANLIRDGYARFHSLGGYQAGGIEVNRSMNVISAEGQVIQSLWATGVVTEGSRFYTTVLSRPGAPSRLEEDAENSVTSMFYAIAQAESVNRRQLTNLRKTHDVKRQF
jgi:uncharacterized NAD(P)/FAD-binding protein YdhS